MMVGLSRRPKGLPDGMAVTWVAGGYRSVTACGYRQAVFVAPHTACGRGGMGWAPAGRKWPWRLGLPLESAVILGFDFESGEPCLRLPFGKQATPPEVGHRLALVGKALKFLHHVNRGMSDVCVTD